jgi:hypothetical protein
MIRGFKVWCLLVGLALGCDASAKSSERLTGVVRAGGEYSVARIDRNLDGSYVVEFRSPKASGRFDTLILHSDHVHVGVKVGSTVRLSAEVAAEIGPLAEVAQVVMYLPSNQGPSPVWLLSRNRQHRDLKAARYKDQHDPRSDYRMF